MSDWTLIYSTTAVGTTVSGSLKALVTTVRSGVDVKVIYTLTTGMQWSRYCSAVAP